MKWRLMSIWLLALLPFAVALDFAQVRGRYLVGNSTNRLIIPNGIWYQLSNATTSAERDALLDAAACTRDAALMADMGFNLIYVDAIDATQNHNDCFSIFNSVGIYVALVLRPLPFVGSAVIDRSYTTDLMKETFEIIDAVKDYENLLGIEAGIFPPYYMFEDLDRYADAQKLFRAFIRDTREYIALNSPRPIPVGGTLPMFENHLEMNFTAIYDYQTCHIPGEALSSAADFIGIDYMPNIQRKNDTEYLPNSTFERLNIQLENATTPVWLSRYCTSQLKDGQTFEVNNATLQETAHLYDPNLRYLKPFGVLDGGARFEWTNVQLSDMSNINWGITMMDSKGNLQLTENYNILRDIFSRYNTDSWRAGGTILSSDSSREECSPELIASHTWTESLSLATDWQLPTRPPGLDSIITSGARGTRGQMVDVVTTTFTHEIRDHTGAVVTDVVLSPSRSQARSTTAAGTGGSTAASSSGSMSTGAKAGIGVGVGIGGALAVAALGFFLLRRRRNKKLAAQNGVTKAKLSNSNATSPDSYNKAELATGPDVEATPPAELPGNNIQTLGEVPGDTVKPEADGGFPGLYDRTGGPPVELPTSERTQELPLVMTPAEERGRPR